MVKEAIVLCFTCEQNDSVIQMCSNVHVSDYVVSVLSFNGFFISPNNQEQYLYLCSDVCCDSYLNGCLTPVLCQINHKSNFDFTNPIWLKTNRDSLNSVRLYIVDSSGKIPSFDKCHFSCSLVFVPLK